MEREKANKKTKNFVSEETRDFVTRFKGLINQVEHAKEIGCSIQLVNAVLNGKRTDHKGIIALAEQKINALIKGGQY